MKFPPLSLDAFLSLLRMMLTGFGSYLIGHYFMGQQITAEVWTVYLGFLLSVGSLIWGIRAKTVGIEQWQSVMRQFFTIAGGLVLAKGWLTQTAFESITGIIMFLLSWSQSVTSSVKAREIAEGKIDVMKLKGVKKAA